MRKNTYELFDYWYDFLGYPSKEGHFYDFEESIENRQLNRIGAFKHYLYVLEIDPSLNGLHHSRSVYTIIDLFGDVGGVLEIFVLLFIFFIQPLTEFSFLIKFIQKFYK